MNYVHDSRSYLHVDINEIFRCGGFPLLALTFPSPSMSNSIYTPTVTYLSYLYSFIYCVQIMGKHPIGAELL